MEAFETFHIVNLFADAIAENDFEKAKSCLRDDVQIILGADVISGKENVIGFYEGKAAQAKNIFQEVAFQALVLPADDHNFNIMFSDILKFKGHEHTYKCLHAVVIPDEKGIAKIEHTEIAGELEGLGQFIEENQIMP